jgi:ribosome-associated toxin RatA of RatAB toxin-antitoxin module
LTILEGCHRKENAWNIISNYALYPGMMDNVDKVEICERNGDEGVSRWYITVEDAPLYWVEKDYFDSPNYEIVFKSIEGDFDNINGHWSIKDHIESGIQIRFEIQYNLGIPVIEEVLGHILKEKMKANIDRMMGFIRNELGAKAAEERRHERLAIGSRHAFLLNDTPLGLFLLNFSAGGMMTRFQAGLPRSGMLDIAGTLVDIEAIYQNPAQNVSHFVFRRPLPQELFEPLLTRLTRGRGWLQPSGTEPHEALVFFDKQEVPVTILNLARDRMSLQVQGVEVPHMQAFTIGSSAIQVNEVLCDRSSNTVDLRFSNSLSDEQFLWMQGRFAGGAR